MSMDNLAYARIHYQSFCRSARHLLQIIGSHQSPYTGWAYLSYACLALETSLTVRRVIQLVAFLETNRALEVRRGHGRGHVNFYRILREEDGLPVPHCSPKKVKSETPIQEEKVKFPTPPTEEKVKYSSPIPLETQIKLLRKVVNTKEREKKEAPPAPFSLSPQEGADAPETSFISPEVARKFHLCYGIEDWPPPRRAD